MCGRYQLAITGRTLATMLDVQPGAGVSVTESTWNAAPTQQLPVIARARDGSRVLERATWGLVPGWARRTGRPMRPLINARAETVVDKPAFRSAVRTGRVLVPITGFYEWAGPAGSKVPHAFRVRGEAVEPRTGQRLGHDAAPEETAEPFLLAGIAEVWTSPDNVPELTYTVLTTTPNELCAPVHDRMPAILDPDDAEAWLETPPEATDLLLELLRPFPAERMEAWTVRDDVSNVRNDGPLLAAPVDRSVPTARRTPAPDDDSPATLF